jgi:hypothetical protein
MFPGGKAVKEFVYALVIAFGLIIAASLYSSRHGGNWIDRDFVNAN